MSVVESQSECDGALSVKSDGNDVESNGETDDKTWRSGEMEFDDGCAQARNFVTQPTDCPRHQEHMSTHRPYRSWCQFCVMGRGVNSPHRISDPQDVFGRDAPCVNGLRISRREGI